MVISVVVTQIGGTAHLSNCESWVEPTTVQDYINTGLINGGTDREVCNSLFRNFKLQVIVCEWQIRDRFRMSTKRRQRRWSVFYSCRRCMTNTWCISLQLTYRVMVTIREIKKKNRLVQNVMTEIQHRSNDTQKQWRTIKITLQYKGNNGKPNSYCQKLRKT